MKEQTTYYFSPVGLIKITGKERGITGLHFTRKEGPSDSKLFICLNECRKQLDEYFAGKRKQFDLPILFDGTDFQKQVWNKLKSIPYGQTLSYGDIARMIKHPQASRAVGSANNRNRISIIVPCHRVVGSDGSMTGYASGVWRKEWLLEHERQHC